MIKPTLLFPAILLATKVLDLNAAAKRSKIHSDLLLFGEKSQQWASRRVGMPPQIHPI
jgi:hypothetical protein